MKKKTQSNLHLNGDAHFLFQRLLLISFTLSVIRRQVLRRYRFQLFSFEIFLSLLVSRARSPMMNVLSPIKYKHEMNLWSHLFRSRLAGCYEIRHPRWLWKHSYRITFKVLLFDTPRTAPKSKKICRVAKVYLSAPNKRFYSHFISRMTLVDSGGNICPLLAWHV